MGSRMKNKKMKNDWCHSSFFIQWSKVKRQRLAIRLFFLLPSGRQGVGLYSSFFI